MSPQSAPLLPLRRLASQRLRAALGVLLVTLIWSIGSLLFKITLRTVPPLSLTAYQVTLAAAAVMAAAAWRGETSALRRADRRLLGRLALMGLSRYTIGQAAMILALARLPVSTAAFLFSFASLTVMLLGIPYLREWPTWLQVAGILLCIAGAYFFFGVRPRGQQWLGIVFAAVNIVGFSFHNVIARGVGRAQEAGNLLVTGISLACGAPLLLLAAWLVDGPGCVASFGQLGLLAVLWGGLLDTGLSLSLWNRALRVLWSFEVSVLARAQMVEVPLLARWLLGDQVGGRQWLGILVTLAGIALTQRRRREEEADGRI